MTVGDELIFGERESNGNERMLLRCALLASLALKKAHSLPWYDMVRTRCTASHGLFACDRALHERGTPAVMAAQLPDDPETIAAFVRSAPTASPREPAPVIAFSRYMLALHSNCS